MKKVFLLLAISVCVITNGQSLNETIKVSDNIQLLKLSESAYIHISYRMSEQWGRIGANGFIYINNNEAFLFDTPWTNEQTEKLISWVSDSLGAKIIGFVPNHWHADCMGGMECIRKNNIKSYANQMTIDMAKEKELYLPENGFKDSLKIAFNNKTIECYYLGAAHAMDNIVVWLPSDKILFAGCVLKGLSYNNIGFTDHGDLKEYPKTLNKVLAKFPDANIVVPGHGNYGGVELLHHNLKLLNQ